MKRKRQSRQNENFWLAPLLIGSCLASGYELTHRFLIFEAARQSSSEELFQTQRSSEKESLEEFKSRSESTHSTPSIDQYFLNTKTIGGARNSRTSISVALAEDMQNALNALETYEEVNPMSPQENVELSISKLQRIFHQQNFDELFKTLQGP